MLYTKQEVNRIADQAGEMRDGVFLVLSAGAIIVEGVSYHNGDEVCFLLTKWVLPNLYNNENATVFCLDEMKMVDSKNYVLDQQRGYSSVEEFNADMTQILTSMNGL